MTNPEKIKFIKEFQRNYSLFQVIAYSEYNKRKIPEFSNEVDIGHPLFVYEPGSLGKIYYKSGELKEIFSKFGLMASNPDYSHKVIDKFTEVLEKIKPFFEKKKQVNNLEELKDLYELYLDFSYGEAAIWVIPLIESLPLEIREKALAVREKTERFGALRDELFDFNLNKIYPLLGRYSHFVHPKSVFLGMSADELIKEARKYIEGFLYFNGDIYFGDFNKILERLNIELEDNIHSKSDNFVKGQCACQGIVKGKAKLIFTNEDISKVNKGDIIVSPMTRPDFMIAIEKAAGIVTDEGGITCHAAIVSREFQIPCVVGTSYATQIFKDGDIIEIDADKGIVRRIEEK